VPDLWGILIPVTAAAVMMVGAAWVVRKYAGPAQAASAAAQSDYRAAVDGRLRILMAERDEAKATLDRMALEICDLRKQVDRLEREVRMLTAENLELLRRLPPGGKGGE
jgi:hypothetical protein